MEQTQHKLTPKEAADYLGCSVSLVYQLADERRIAHFRIGGRGRRGKYSFTLEALDAFLESCKIEVTPAPTPEKKFRHLRP